MMDGGRIMSARAVGDKARKFPFRARIRLTGRLFHAKLYYIIDILMNKNTKEAKEYV